MKIEIFEGGLDRNLSYLIIDERSKEGFVIDPFKNIEIYFNKAKKLNVKIVGVLNTHSHRDHVEGNPAFVKKGVQIINPLVTKIKIEERMIKIIKTPGHCDDSVCFYFPEEKILITGDTLLPGRVGLTRDFEGSRILFKSLKKLLKLPDNVKVYPGHHYNKEIPLALGGQKRTNPYLNCESVDEFEKLVDKWREHTRNYFANKCC